MTPARGQPTKELLRSLLIVYESLETLSFNDQPIGSSIPESQLDEGANLDAEVWTLKKEVRALTRTVRVDPEAIRDSYDRFVRIRGRWERFREQVSSSEPDAVGRVAEWKAGMNRRVDEVLAGLRLLVVMVSEGHWTGG
jgi:hypothetical protein